MRVHICDVLLSNMLSHHLQAVSCIMSVQEELGRIADAAWQVHAKVSQQGDELEIYTCLDEKQYIR